MKKLLFIVLACIAILTACNQDHHFTYEIEKSGPMDRKRITVSVVDTSKTVDINQAMFVGQRFMSNTSGSRSISTEVKDIQLISSDNNPLYYIINYTGGGYIIVSATKGYYPVLAYSDDGYFSTEKAQDSGVSIWMDMQEEIINNIDELQDSVKTEISLLWSQYNTKKKEIALTEMSRSDPDMTYQISYSISEWQQQGYTVYSYSDFLGSPEYTSLTPGERNAFSSAANESYNYGYTPDEIVYIKTKTTLVDTIINPLTSTTWNQSGGYNKFVPNYDPNDQRWWPLGCVTVAIAQIMRKHTKPDSIQWNTFPNSYCNDALAHFLYEVALAADVQFGYTESGSNINKAKNALINYGYNYAKIRSYDTDTIRKQLKAGRPLFMKGISNNKGHAWVCDGYRSGTSETEITAMLYAGENSLMAGSNWNTLYSQTNTSIQPLSLSMNWGWGGYCNGLYISTNLNPNPGEQKHYGNIEIIYDIY